MWSQLVKHKTIIFRSYTTKAKRSLLNQDQSKIKGNWVPYLQHIQ